MMCQQCNEKPAVVHVDLHLNQENRQLYLCKECFAKVKNGISSPAGMFSFGGSPFDDFFHGVSGNWSANGPAAPERNASNSNHREGLLDQIGKNLTERARAGEIDPVVGRDKEIERVIEILNRRNKNNPVLIGEPGVGKTAIAEGLALRIAEGQVPSKLKDKEIYLLDVASLVADTGIRGQFEERMKQLIAEVEEQDQIILFIDEIHLLVGAGSAQGSMDAGNLLKPALARGELQVVGATTLKEYRQIEKDAALERRFQPVRVQEPSVQEAIEILKGIRSKYEDYHEVRFTDEALQACATLSNRFIQDRHLPDKAIDLLDEAGSKVNLLAAQENTSSLENELAQVIQEKERATAEENYERAAELRDLETQLKERLAQASQDRQAAREAVVTLEDIQRIVEQKTGIPVRKLQADEQSKMKNLDQRLSEKVIGQEEAVQKISKAIRRSRAGLKPKNRPIGSFLFVGPTGVGKTELSKCLAEELFGDRDSMIRFDMSEYMERHSVSKLIGSPPGYVGHEEAGQLTERVRRNPYSILLLDEIEKAHPDVQHLFLQILEDGRLTDSQGRTVSFKDTVIIMTSNAGAGEKKAPKVGFNQSETQSDESNRLDFLRVYFKPEFLNRFDAIVEFKPLQEEHLIEIVNLLLSELQSNLQEQGVNLKVSFELKRKLAQLGYHPAFGARPLRRVIQEQLEDQIADVLLDSDSSKQLIADVKDGQITVEPLRN